MHEAERVNIKGEGCLNISLGNMIDFVRNHSFSKFATFSEKLTFVAS